MQDSAKVYNKIFLPVYDWYVLKFSNTFVWKCPSTKILEFYDLHITHNHLDVGAGTGYFLHKARFFEQPNIGLFDVNPNTLLSSAKRIARFHPKTYQADIMQPLTIELPQYDSIAINYLLHCLPGDFYAKEIVFKNLIPHLNPHGVLFGATILADKPDTNWLGRKLLALYNAKGVFGNLNDKLADLDLILQRNFQTYSIYEIGNVVLFAARI